MIRYFQRKVNNYVHLPVAMKFLISWLGLFQHRSVILLCKVGYCGKHAVCYQPSTKGMCSILNIISKNPIQGNAVKAFCRAVPWFRGRKINGAFPLAEQVLHLGESLQEFMIVWNGPTLSDFVRCFISQNRLSISFPLKQCLSFSCRWDNN